jgi:hypothetical protein
LPSRKGDESVRTIEASRISIVGRSETLPTTAQVVATVKAMQKDGLMAWGVVLVTEAGNDLSVDTDHASGYSNAVAEYTAIITALKESKKFPNSIADFVRSA